MGAPGYFPCDELFRELKALGANHGLQIHPLNFSGLYEADPKNVGGCNHPSAAGIVEMASIARASLERVLGWGEA